MAREQREVITELLELYRDLPCLWDLTHETYKDQTQKKNAWDILAMKLKEIDPTANAASAKKKIDNLKISYIRESKKVKESKNRTGSSTSDVHKPNLWFYELMTFLERKNDVKRKGMDTLMSDDENTSESPNLRKETPPLQQVKKSKKTSQDEFLEIATEYLKRPDSETEVIAKGWAVKLNRLAPDQRRYAEKIINDVLFEGEMGTLSRNGFRISPANSPSYSSSSANSHHAIMTYPYQSPSPLRPPASPSPSSHHAIMTYPYQSPSPLRPPASPSPNSHHAIMTYPYQSPSPLRPPASPSPNSHHATMTYPYQSPLPLRPPASPSPNSHHSTMTYSYQSPSPNAHHSTIKYQSPAPLQSPSPNALHSTITYQSPAPHQSPSPNAHHSTITYQSPAPYQSPSPNAHHSTITYQSPAPHQSSSPNAHHSTITYQSPAPHQSPSPNAHHSTITYQSPAPHQSPSPNAHHSTIIYQSPAPHQSQVTRKSMVHDGATPLIILSSQPVQAPSQSHEQPVLIHIPDPATEEEKESHTAAKFLENFYSF